jgi:hypothetical protein
MTDQLLQILREKAHPDGVAFAQEEFLLHRLSADAGRLARALETLESRGAITVLSPLPFLTAKVKVWSGKAENSAKTGISSYSSSHSGNISKNSYRDGTGDLLNEILSVLGESDPEPFRKATELYAPHVIRLALNRVRKAQAIQKSRTALFRYLLPRIAKEGSVRR